MRRTLLTSIFTSVSLLFADGMTVNNQSKETKRPSSPGQPRARGPSGKSTSITGSRIKSPRLVEILNYGFVRELSSDPPKPEQELRLRLYAVPKEGNCLLDTHVVCSHHYYLAVSSFEEGAGEAVYDLGEVGEISNIQWLKANKPWEARLRLTVTNYPVDYFKTTKTLIRQQKDYELYISIDKLMDHAGEVISESGRDTLVLSSLIKVAVLLATNVPSSVVIVISA